MSPHNIFNRLLDLFEKNERPVLAQLIDTQGSTPQVAGAAALYGDAGLLTGTVGGGSLEEEAGYMASLGLRDRVSRIYRFDLKEGEKSEPGAVCGGEAVLLLDADPAVHKAVFHDLQLSLNQRKRGVLITRMQTDSAGRISISRFWREEKEEAIPLHSLPFPGLYAQINKAFSRGQPELFSFTEQGLEEKSSGQIFVQPVFPRQRLLIIGAGHIGRAVSHWGRRLGFEVIVVDDRPEYASEKRLPDADNIIVAAIDEAVRRFPIGSDTYIVIVTRGHQYDEVALRECIGSPAAYIGMIGSKNKIKHAHGRFISEGWATPKQLERLYAPIGLDIDSKTVEEIAVSIAAQLVQKRRQIQSLEENII